jgi:hypothetical protein
MLSPDERERLARDYLGWARHVAWRDLSHTHRGRQMVERDTSVIDDTVDLAMVRALDRWDTQGVSFASFLAHQIRFEVCNKLRPPRRMGRLRRWSFHRSWTKPELYTWAFWHGLSVSPEWEMVMDNAPEAVDAGDTLDAILTDATPRTATVFRLLAAGHTHDEISAKTGLGRWHIGKTIYLHRPELQARWEAIA